MVNDLPVFLSVSGMAEKSKLIAPNKSSASDFHAYTKLAPFRFMRETLLLDFAIRCLVLSFLQRTRWGPLK